LKSRKNGLGQAKTARQIFAEGAGRKKLSNQPYRQVLKLRMHFPAKDESMLWQPWLRATLAIGLALLAFQLLAPGQQQNVTEDQVEAAYLFNFAKLAEWPRFALPDASSPLVIGVSGGDDEFLHVLKAVVAGKIVGAHILVVKPINSEEGMKSCQIVFFRASERKHTQAAIEGLRQAGVLLVGEDETFLGQGGMINLVKVHGRIHFEVNPDALDRSEIHFSSKILALARTGYGAPPTVEPNSTTPVVAARRLERSVPPQYPAIAARLKLTGTVQVQALVKPDGTVKEVKILGGHPMLAAAVASAVMQWKFQPAPKETLEAVKFSFGPQ
jgi:TonB family protein